MAKKRLPANDEPEDPVGPPDPDHYNASDDEVRPGETMDEYMDRKDDEDSQWKGKQGGRGAAKHDANESRRPPKADEYYDPHLGNN